MISPLQNETCWIATDNSAPYVAIYGVGASAEEAIYDARQQSHDEDATFTTLPASDALVRMVQENGGGPGDVNWTVENGTAVLRG